MIKDTNKIKAFLKARKEEPRNEEGGKGVQKPGQNMATAVITQRGLEPTGTHPQHLPVPSIQESKRKRDPTEVSGMKVTARGKMSGFFISLSAD